MNIFESFSHKFLQYLADATFMTIGVNTFQIIEDYTFTYQGPMAHQHCLMFISLDHSGPMAQMVSFNELFQMKDYRN